MYDIQKHAQEKGWDTISFVGRRKVYDDLPCEKFGNKVSFWIHVIVNTLLDRQGYASFFQTKKLIRRIKEECPDVIHLHNLHGYYLNIPLLFHYLTEEYKGKIFWTFHDLWPITGHCPHFAAVKCDKWQSECKKCPNKRLYPISWGLDNSRRNFREKKKVFSSLRHLEIIAPSKWMAEQIEKSFLGSFPIRVIPNGIDLSNFAYSVDVDIFSKYNIPRDKSIILGVASVWDERKGLNDFLQLAEKLSDDYIIVLVGLSIAQIGKLPNNVIGIRRTENRKELACFYSAADVLINPSKEESFSLVTIEAMACGTPVIGIDTSAVRELINDDNGILLHENNCQQYLQAINILQKSNKTRETIRRTVLAYSNKNMVENVLQLY